MSANVTERSDTMHDPDREFTGKYEEAGRIGGMLLDRFYSAVHRLLVPHLRERSALLEVGCGAGYSSQRLLRWLPESASFLGSDVGETLLEKAAARNPGAKFARQSVYELALPDKSVDVVVMLEVLEHLEFPERALVELQRVSREAVILSTPREPLWRFLNFCRGKYVRDLGNTPGHIQHWSSRGLCRQVQAHFEVCDVARPIPWTVLSLKPRQ
ncbi:methyltransferase domain-containing protein [Lysobacter maris]|uniref:Methyltransferase domain-containing protein n=1 Tax=Marilutibacter maris TaxID=1605891 RepID=A0A508AZ70_9GAMM|nr:methyltransferase domain-containing protein [Lysobacter maris]